MDIISVLDTKTFAATITISRPKHLNGELLYIELHYNHGYHTIVIKDVSSYMYQTLTH